MVVLCTERVVVVLCAGRVLCAGLVVAPCAGRVVEVLCAGRVLCAGLVVAPCTGRAVEVLCAGRVLTAGLTVDEAETCLPLKREETLSIMAEGRELSAVRTVEFVLTALS